MRDFTLRGPRAGKHWETKRYGYYRRGDGDWVRDSWVIAHDKPGAVGPFEMTREVAYAEWVLPETDERRMD